MCDYVQAYTLTQAFLLEEAPVSKLVERHTNEMQNECGVNTLSELVFLTK